MRVMVLGGTGLLGHETVRVLLERGHEVTLLARHSPPQSLTALRDLPVVIADAVTTQPDEFAHLLSGFDAAVYAMDRAPPRPAPAPRGPRSHLHIAAP